MNRLAKSLATGRPSPLPIPFPAVSDANCTIWQRPQAALGGTKPALQARKRPRLQESSATTTITATAMATTTRTFFVLSPRLFTGKKVQKRNAAVKELEKQLKSREESMAKVMADRDILKFGQVYVVDQQGHISGPFSSRVVLATHLDLEHETIVVVQNRIGTSTLHSPTSLNSQGAPAPTTAANDEQATPMVVAGNPDLPVCRIFDRRELQERDEQIRGRLQEQIEAEQNRKVKVVEISWGSDRKDTEVKLRRLQDFLTRGHRVELLVFNKRPKKGSKKKRDKFATPSEPAKNPREEREDLIRSIEQAVAEIPGAKEAKPRDGVGTLALTFFFEVRGSASKKAGEDASRAGAADGVEEKASIAEA